MNVKIAMSAVMTENDELKRANERLKDIVRRQKAQIEHIKKYGWQPDQAGGGTSSVSGTGEET